MNSPEENAQRAKENKPPGGIAISSLPAFNSVAVKAVEQKLAPGGAGSSAAGARTALAAAGFCAVVGQIVLMRELIQVFNGNEISLGILLGTWLLWTAVGSGAASGILGVFASAAGLGRSRPRLAVGALECVLAVSLPATIWALRDAKGFFRPFRANWSDRAHAAHVARVPERVLRGIGCAVCRGGAHGQTEGGISARAAASSAYLLEAAGAGLGGIMASVVLVRYLDSFQIAAVAGS